MKEIIIRQEKLADLIGVYSIVEEAFRNMKHADGDEQELVERLRKSKSFIPELSLVAELDGKIVGHILFTRIWIVNESNRFESLSLAPLSVRPDSQNQGIGGALILEGHRRASEMGFNSIVVLGHEDYYPRFGYEICRNYGLSLPFEAADENCMVLELSKGSLKEISGEVEYPKEFF
jgi:predicted N-acetyltransferase YhbS